jgi:hypothetical protein
MPDRIKKDANLSTEPFFIKSDIFLLKVRFKILSFLSEVILSWFCMDTKSLISFLSVGFNSVK